MSASAPRGRCRHREVTASFRRRACKWLRALVESQDVASLFCQGQHPLLEAQMATFDARRIQTGGAGRRARAGGDLTHRSVSEERDPSVMREREMLEGCRERERGGGGSAVVM